MSEPNGGRGPTGATGAQGPQGDIGPAGVDAAVAIEDLVAANRESNRTMVALVEHVQRETAARDKKIAVIEHGNRMTRMLTYLLASAMIVVLALAVVNAYNLAATRKQADQLTQLNTFLLDCVNSTGECGRRNAEAQRQLLDKVKQYELTGFYCARNNPAIRDPEGDAFLACMKRLYPGGPTLEGR